MGVSYAFITVFAALSLFLTFTLFLPFKGQFRLDAF
jgi:hypothetical protein